MNGTEQYVARRVDHRNRVRELFTKVHAVTRAYGYLRRGGGGRCLAGLRRSAGGCEQDDCEHETMSIHGNPPPQGLNRVSDVAKPLARMPRSNSISWDCSIT